MVFLYVGRVSIEKDLDILSESYKVIHEKYGDKVALVITGNGPYLEKCKEIFPKNTTFTGFKKAEKLAQIYAFCDVFVCPSSTETFGNVVLEAMASGIPVIGADAGGVGEIIYQGRIPGQVIIQYTDSCNALYPQCSMKKTEAYDRSKLPEEELYKIIDSVAKQKIQALSFIGGEPFIYEEKLLSLIQYVSQRNIPYIRTGTNARIKGSNKGN